MNRGVIDVAVKEPQCKVRGGEEVGGGEEGGGEVGGGEEEGGGGRGGSVCTVSFRTTS